MRPSVKKQKNTFYGYYKSLKETKEKVKVRNLVLEHCGISYPAFYAKIRRENFNFLERKEIEKLLNKKFNW